MVLENQQWVRLLPKQVCDLSGQSQVFLLVPPTVDANGVVKYSFKVREIKQALSRMMAVKSEVCN
ncbi:MAG: hypothetical protein P8107_03510 [Spirochaetia bacterium]